MTNVIDFPRSAQDKLVYLQVRTSDRSSQFTPEFKEQHKSSDPCCETTRVYTKELHELQDQNIEYWQALNEISLMSLWDRIFNWPYKG